MQRIRSWAGTAADAVTLFAVGVAVLMAAVAGAWVELRQVGVGWAIVAAVGVFLIVVGGSRGLLNWWKNRTDPVGEEFYLRAKRIRLADMALPGHPLIEGRTFERCRFLGPAVVDFVDCTLRGGDWQTDRVGGPDSMYIEVPEGKILVGTFRFQNCVFQDCHFQWIAWIGTPRTLAHVKEQVTPVQEFRGSGAESV